MKRPSFQFYPADWRNNAKLRRCSEAARGAWMDVLCVLHDMDEYGVCRWPLADLARSSNISLKLIKELVDKDVLKGADKNAEPYIFTPRHAGKDGEPVTLVESKGQPIWYCSRFVRDEYIRQRRGQSTRFDEDNQPAKIPPKDEPKASPKPPIGEELGDGSTSSSSSTSKLSNVFLDSNLVPNQDGLTHTQFQTGLIAQGLTKIGLMPFNPTVPEFIALIEAGATVDEFVNTALEKKGDMSKFNFSYLLTTMTNRRIEAAKKPQLHKGAMPASTSREAGRNIAAKSFFTPEYTQHLQGNQTNLVESENEVRAITN